MPFIFFPRGFSYPCEDVIGRYFAFSRLSTFKHSWVSFISSWLFIWFILHFKGHFSSFKPVHCLSLDVFLQTCNLSK